MTTLPSKDSSMLPKADDSNFNELNEILPKQVTYADSLNPKQSEKMWNEMYKLAGLATADEKKKKGLRMWAYIQACLNGTSRQGDYSTVDKLYDGTDVASAIIPRVAGRDIRKFFRANMEESYKFLKSTAAMENYSRFISHCNGMGVGASEAFATADWMDDCQLFTPKERIAHEVSFNTGIERARRARQGKTLEGVEGDRLRERVHVNGPNHEAGRVTEIADF